ncbi:CoA transferase [Sphingomonas sp. BK235]|uniref:CaiB/BaiF CoA transferase family protein n=1 Tax=Sphingomonas sp. BK235 TaxID=2512131 RepID=UPI00104BE105|nr:CoA transferase [Sphingomonas sp. BK235]TCP31016.1 crotonobetainyl-CoA:carnitine CoA-transferase CaiB-like acyl-CoA transferase [Sphingomonas sp. BK235]
MIPLLKGVRIIEIGAVVLGPYAGQILADLGADVIKVEPLTGDVARASYPQGAGAGALFVNNNRNKRALAIDLKSEEGHAALMRMIAGADVLLHNIRADAAARLRLSFADARAANANIIYCAAAGFGSGGRYRERPAFDDIIQAASGLAGLAMETPSGSGEAEPRFVPTILADKVAALHVVYAILAALVARGRGTAGAVDIEVPMFEAMAAFLLNEHLAAATFRTDGDLHYPRMLSEDRRPFRTADAWIAVLPYTGAQWRRFLNEIGRNDVATQPWFADAAMRQARLDELYAIVAAAMPARSTAAWLAALRARDIPCSEVNRLSDLLDDAHLADVDFFGVDPTYPDDIVRKVPQPVRFGGLPVEPDTPPPALGHDSRQVLADAGLADDAIESLIARGIVVTPAPALEESGLC